MNPEPPPPGDAAFRMVGHYFIILGVAALVSTPMGVVFDRRESFDFSFILLWWIGGALLQRGRWARRFAIALCATGLAGSGWILVLSLLGRAAGATVSGAKNPAPDLAALSCGVAVTMFLLPLILLLRPEARRLAGVPPEPRPPRRFAVAYVVAILMLVSGGLSFHRLIRRESLAQSTTFIRRADGASAGIVKLVVEDGGNPPVRSLIRWIISDLPSSSFSEMNADRGVLVVNGASITFSPLRSWIFARPSRAAPGDANVLLIDKDGREREIPRRVTLATAAAAQAAVTGFADLDDLERRLLSALPE